MTAREQGVKARHLFPSATHARISEASKHALRKRYSQDCNAFDLDIGIEWQGFDSHASVLTGVSLWRWKA